MAPQKLSGKIEGGYFFFLGEKGAKATVEKIYDLVVKIRSAQNELHRALVSQNKGYSRF